MTARHAALLALLVACVAVAANGVAGGALDTLSARGAVLRPSVTPTTVMLALPERLCRLLLNSSAGTCGSIVAGRFEVMYTIDPGPRVDDVLVSRPWVVRVHELAGDVDRWRTVLETRRQGHAPGPVYADVRAEVGDVTGDGEPELVVGYRSEGTGQILDLDIVGIGASGEPVVLAHEQLYKGVARIDRGRLVTWTPVYDKLEANCCPSWIRRDVVRFEHGAFVVHHGKKVPTEDADIPRGDF